MLDIQNHHSQDDNSCEEMEEEEIVLNDDSCDRVTRWWNNGGGPIPFPKEDGELLEPKSSEDENDENLSLYRDSSNSSTRQPHPPCDIHNNDSFHNDLDGNGHHHESQQQPLDDYSISTDENTVLSLWRRNDRLPNERQPDHHYFPRPVYYPNVPQQPQHNYYNYDPIPRNDDNQKLWKRYILVALVAILLHRYCPPPPASSERDTYYRSTYSDSIHSSWGEYVFFSGKRALNSMAGISQTLWYIGSGVIHNVVQDGSDAWLYLYDSVGWNRNEYPSTSRFVCPISHMDTTTTKEYLSKQVVGQTSTIRVLSTALDAWHLDSETDDKKKLQKPFVIWLTGSQGIGKTQIAHTLSHYIFQRCSTQSKDANTLEDNSCILELYGHDFTDHHHTEEPSHLSAKHPFLISILQHVQKCKSGSVIIIKHMEEMSSGHQLMELVRFIQKKRHSNTFSTSSNGQKKITQYYGPNDLEKTETYNNNNKYDSSSQSSTSASSSIPWKNVLFIFTSNIGVNKINQALRRYEDISSVPFTQLQNSVRNEIDEFFFDNRFKLGNFINVVAPLFPLGFKEMREIMRLKLKILSLQNEKKKWKRLDVSDHAVSHFVGPNFVDYIEWKRQAGGNERASHPYIFSKHGALNLDDGIFLQTIRAKIARSFFNKPDKVAQINYDTHSDEIVISWCNHNTSDDDDDDDEGLEMTEGEPLHCSEEWRSQID